MIIIEFAEKPTSTSGELAIGKRFYSDGTFLFDQWSDDNHVHQNINVQEAKRIIEVLQNMVNRAEKELPKDLT